MARKRDDGAVAAPRSRGAPDIGPLLRERRRELGLTLEAAAGAAGLTKSFLSDVERDRASLSVASLVRLCEVLGLSVGQLFTPARNGIVRAAERAPIGFGGIGVADVLVSPGDARRLQAILSTLAPGGSGGEDLYAIRAEEEFVFVLSGRLVIRIGEEAFELDAGDAMAFDPRRPHTFANASQEAPAQALFVITPPPL